MVLKHVRPNIWLSFLVISWGITMTCMGAVQSYSGPLACRVMLGLAEVLINLFPVFSPLQHYDC